MAPFRYNEIFYSVKTWKGEIDEEFLDRLKKEYGRRLLRFKLPIEENSASNEQL